MKKNSTLITFFVLLTVLFSTLTAANAADVSDSYYYPNYDVQKSGYVDLMKYMKDITVSLNGKDYTTAETEALKSSGKQLEMGVGDLLTFKFHFSFCGRAYSSSDRTLLDESRSSYVSYSNATKFLNGRSAKAGERAILDDSSLMKYTTGDGTVLRMDIAWLLKLCPEDYKCSFKGDRIAFRQGTGADSHYLYFYFPDGIGSDVYANDGYFSIDARIGEAVSKIVVPGKPGYYVPGSDWDFQLKAVKYAELGNTGRISSYGDITVKKVWATEKTHPDAKIVLSYKMNGLPQTATRTIKGNGSAVFTIRDGMTDCVLSEDMTGLSGYRSDMTQDSSGTVFTFTNTRAESFYFGKTDENGVPVSGAELVLYKLGADGSRTEFESWTSGGTARKIMLPSGKYLLREKKAPVGYAAAEDAAFEITDAYILKGSDSKTVSIKGSTLNLIDQSLYVSITKTDNEGNPLSGATIRIVDLTTDEVVDVWVSDGTTHTVTRTGSSGVVFNSLHKYRLEEVSAPAGYKRADLIDFTFNADGTINGRPYRLFNIKNARKSESDSDQPAILDMLYISITKTDNEGNPLSGATIRVVDLTTGEIVDVWVSDGTTHTIMEVGSEGVAFHSAHKYRLEEVSAPAGYKLADLIDFTFNADGSIDGHPYHLFNLEDDLDDGSKRERDDTDGGGTGRDGTNNNGGGDIFSALESFLYGGNEKNNGIVNSGIERVQTGDSIAMWVELGLSVLCFAGAIALFLVLRSRSDSGKRRRSDR